MNIFYKVLDAMADKEISEEDKLKISNFTQDPIAAKTLWWNCNPGGSKYKNYSLRENDPILEYHLSTKGIVWSLFLILIFGLFLSIDVYDVFIQGGLVDSDNTSSMLFYGACFSGTGYYFIKNMRGKKVFDKTIHYFYIGKMPAFFESDGKTLIPFSQIHALQIVSEFISGKYNNYKSYELNLVLKDATRVNIVDHKDIEQIRIDAQKTSIFLGVPVWDITL